MQVVYHVNNISHVDIVIYTIFMDESLKKKAEIVLKNKGDMSLAHLDAIIELGDKLEALTEAVQSIPETVIPEYPEAVEEVSITNLPEVQKVEITNLPSEKDDSAQIKLLQEISKELKKKEQYAYDIEIDPTLKEQLKGEKGEQGERGSDGVDGKDGVDGNEIEPEEIVAKLSTLYGEDRLDAKHIKNLPAQVSNGFLNRSYYNRGLSKSIQYTSSGLVDTITSVNGTVQFTYNNGQLVSMGGAGINQTFVYSSGGELTNINVS